MNKVFGLLILFISLLLYSNATTIHINEESEVKDLSALKRTLCKLNDKEVEIDLEKQITDKEHIFYGGLLPEDSVISPILTANMIRRMSCSYVLPTSIYFNSDKVLQRMELAVAHLLNIQHDDGTFDLTSTNFHSTPDTAFALELFVTSYRLLASSQNDKTKKLLFDLKKIIVNAGEALINGGIHTPNHRWVVSASLSLLDQINNDPKYVQRANEWLSEKIDIDEDGQYNERSTYTYTPIIDRMLIMMAKNWDKPYLYEYVRKNLDMTMYLIRPNGEIVTEISNRQDKYVVRNAAPYYFAYRYMAIFDKNPYYAAMTRYIENNVPPKDLLAVLPLFIEYDILNKQLVKSSELPTVYNKHLKASDIVRIRKDSVDVSILKANPLILSFVKNDAVLRAMRLSASFFGDGQFVAQNLKIKNNTYILTSSKKAGYYQPLPERVTKKDGWDWEITKTKNRAVTQMQYVNTTVSINEHEGKVSVNVNISGPKYLPILLELYFDKGGNFSNVVESNMKNSYYLQNGEYATYTNGNSSIKIGPGIHEHNGIVLRGTLPKLDMPRICLTAYGTCQFNFSIE